MRILKFDPQDPFPKACVEYAAAQAHSAEVDAWLGFEIEKTEARTTLRASDQDQNYWLGLAPKTLQTPYTEMREILEHLQPAPNDLVIDLGAAYGRMAFVLARHYPEVSFTGYEVLPERVAEGLRVMKRAGLSDNFRLEVKDVSDPAFRIPHAQIYFIYDFGSRSAISKVLNDLRETSRSRPFVVVGRGRAVRDAVERHHPWLAAVKPPQHYPHFSIYHS